MRQKWHYMLIKESIQQEDIKVINTYAPNNGVLKQIYQKET